MQQTRYEILIWLPSPLGDAVLCTPALRAIRQYFKDSLITIFANPVVCDVLSSGNFIDRSPEQSTNNPDWTDFCYKNEIRIIGDAPCAPYERPVCKKSEYLCMQAITVEMVCDAAKKLLEDSHREQQQICESKNL
jgi:ADP-heptose:LPS heptosyltransferase